MGGEVHPPMRTMIRAWGASEGRTAGLGMLWPWGWMLTSLLPLRQGTEEKPKGGEAETAGMSRTTTDAAVIWTMTGPTMRVGIGPGTAEGTGTAAKTRTEAGSAAETGTETGIGMVTAAAGMTVLMAMTGTAGTGDGTAQPSANATYVTL